ncbi:MAG: hypothetical protein EPN62_13390 [Candidimonas sp.]|nr:MAG: hypothetical protein EPN77_03195 [Candidimonas sp.]TAM21830.1 MAG: hypothetical protein EPN62_13390 [Candidimonas sp.]
MAATHSSRPPGANPYGAIDSASWQLMGAAALAIRLVIGWVYWGGASRRFIYSIKKIDPGSPGYLANKLVHAAPGSPFGLDHVLHWLLGMPLLLQAAVIGFSLVELVVGVGLIIGFATRLLSLVGLGLALFLMLIFGWMGTTCLDEWTMAACGFAMVTVTLVTGSGPYSVDNWLVKSGRTANSNWLAWITSGPLPISQGRFITITTLLGVIAFVFTVFFYGFYFDAIYSPLGKRTDNLHPRVTMSDAVLFDDRLTVGTYMDRGPDTQGLYIVKATLASKGGTASPLFDYDAAMLKQADTVKITNRFAPWSTCKQIAYGIRCQLGSQSTFSFAVPAAATGMSQDLVLTLTDVEGNTFSAPVSAR